MGLGSDCASKVNYGSKVLLKNTSGGVHSFVTVYVFDEEFFGYILNCFVIN